MILVHFCLRKANESDYYLKSIEQKSANVSFQHTYNVFKYGATPITEGQLLIQIPLSFDGGEPFIVLKTPQVIRF